MSLKIKEKSLQKALEYCFLTGLPEKDDKESLWIMAIAEVTKIDLSTSYVYVEKNPETLENVIKADFGKMVQVYKINEFYPFSYFDASALPTFKNKNGKEERARFLKAILPERDFSSAGVKEMDKEILKFFVGRQLEKEKGARNAKQE